MQRLATYGSVDNSPYERYTLYTWMLQYNFAWISTAHMCAMISKSVISISRLSSAFLLLLIRHLLFKIIAISRTHQIKCVIIGFRNSSTFYSFHLLTLIGQKCFQNILYLIFAVEWKFTLHGKLLTSIATKIQEKIVLTPTRRLFLNSKRQPSKSIFVNSRKYFDLLNPIGVSTFTLSLICVSRLGGPSNASAEQVTEVHRMEFSFENYRQLTKQLCRKQFDKNV